MCPLVDVAVNNKPGYMCEYNLGSQHLRRMLRAPLVFHCSDYCPFAQRVWIGLEYTRTPYKYTESACRAPPEMRMGSCPRTGLRKRPFLHMFPACSQRVGPSSSRDQGFPLSLALSHAANAVAGG